MSDFIEVTDSVFFIDCRIHSHLSFYKSKQQNFIEIKLCIHTICLGFYENFYLTMRWKTIRPCYTRTVFLEVGLLV